MLAPQFVPSMLLMHPDIYVYRTAIANFRKAACQRTMERIIQPKKKMQANDINMIQLSDEDLDRIAEEQIAEVLNAGSEAAAHMVGLILSKHNDKEKAALSVLSGGTPL
tara:strand:+ start:12174 stop:12500 length:327 start_codon:yes stop_codon:yes gene_type:complete